jgi:hypothetical protein
MQELLMAKQSRSYVEQTNLELIGSELKVTEAERRGQL